MKIQSMTGFAQTQTVVTVPAENALTTANDSQLQIHLSIRSVNNRFLDLTIRLADEWRALELPLREKVQSVCKRGKVEVRVQIERLLDESGTQSVNDNAVKSLAHLQHHIKIIAPETRGLSVVDILRWPGVLADQSFDSQAFQAIVLPKFDEVLKEFTQSRLREGKKIAHVLLDTCDNMAQIVQDLRPLVPELIKQYQEKLANQLQEALQQSPQLDNNEWQERVRQEVLLYGMRIDVTEELDRLAAHISEVKDIVNKGGAIGKRLDFMAQELNREANTVGSKSGSKHLADSAMALKLLIEQLREQIQNIE